MLQLGSKVAVATVTDAGKSEWWSRCVQQMKRKSAGKSVGMCGGKVESAAGDLLVVQ